MLIAGLVAIYFLGRSALDGLQALSVNQAQRRAEAEQRTAYPGIATKIALEVSPISAMTAEATQTVEATAAVEILATEVGAPATAASTVTQTALPTIQPMTAIATTVAIIPTNTRIPSTATLRPSATVTHTNSPTQVPTNTSTSTQTATASRTPIPSSTPLPPQPSATFTLSTTHTPTRVLLAALPTNTLRAAPSTNTPRPSATLIPASLTPIPPTLPPLPTSTTVPTAIPVTPTVALVQAPTLPTLAATSTLPRVARRDSCTDKPQPTAVPSPAPRLQAPEGHDVMNILLLGSDADVDPSDPSFRTDTLLIVSINRTTNTVAMLSIPRDLYICIPQYGMQRINVAYQWGEAVGWQPGGGFGLMQETIMYNMGIPIHYYARVSLEGFKQIVDTIGGIDIAVDCPLNNTLRFQGHYDAQNNPLYEPFDLPIGYYHMDGSFALWYARNRQGTSDFDRNRRQQQVLRAIWRSARDQGLIQKAPELWGQATQVVTTNLQLTDILGLIPIALNLQPGDITQFTMVKGYQTEHFRTPAGEDVQVPSPAGFFETLNNFYTPPSNNRLLQEKARVEVYNGTVNADWDKVAADTLVWKGIAAVAKGQAEAGAQMMIIDYTGGAMPASLNLLTQTLKVQQVVNQPDPNRTVDFKVVLGNGYNSCTAPGFNNR